MNNQRVLVSTYAKQKDVSVTTVYRWIEEGKIKSEKIDRFTYVIIETQSTEPVLN